jgi:D-inositol-3-phosphate glycosyltransferase
MTISRRIAFISEHASPAALLGGEDAGGQNVYVDEVARALAQRGYKIDIFTRREAETEPAIHAWAPGVRIINIPAGPPRHVPKDELWPLMPAFRDEMVAFARRSGTSYDLIHGNFWMSGWVACELQQRWSIPAVQLFHALGATKRRHQGNADTSPADRIEIERSIVATASALIASCPHELDELVTDYGANSSRIEMIPLGVDHSTFQPVELVEARRRIGLGLPADARVIVYVGRVLPRKDIRNVVRALALLLRRDLPWTNDCRLLIVGGETREPDAQITPELGELRSLADDLGIGDRVVLVGKRSKDELRDYYCAGDVAVTTPWYEPFGLTPLEAMACGRPVIGADVGGISFTVKHEETGLLVPPKDPSRLADALENLLGNPQRCRALGTGARERVLDQFCWAAVAEATANLYERVISAHRFRHSERERVVLRRRFVAGD